MLDDVLGWGEWTDSGPVKPDLRHGPFHVLTIANFGRFYAAVGDDSSICHDFARIMNIKRLKFTPPERKKWSASHVGLTPAMFSSQSERTMAALS